MGGSGLRIPPGEGASRLGVGFPIVKYRRSAPRHVLFDGKYHQAVAAWMNGEPFRIYTDMP